MRVLMVTPYPPRADGIGEHTRRLVGALRATGELDVEVLTSRRPLAAEGDGVHRRLANGPGSVRSAADAVRELRPDVIHHQFAIPALGVAGLGAIVATAGARRRHGTPLVVTLHEVRRELDLLRGVGRAIHRRLVAAADAVVVHTEEARRLVVDECGADPRAVVVTPLGASRPADDLIAPEVVDTVRDRYGLGRPTVVCFGYLHPDKGIEHLVEAIARLRARAAHGAGSDVVDVVVAGAVRPRAGAFRVFERADRRYEAELRVTVERHRLGDRIRFVGFVPDADVPALLTAARAVVVPCTKVTQSSVLATAIALGTPVVASDLPGLRETLGGAGVLVAPGDPDALADALAGLADDDAVVDLRRRLARRARDLTLDAVAAQLTGVYSDVAGHHTGSRREAIDRG